MGSIIIKNGRVIDPVNGIDEIKNLYILDGKIVSPEAFALAEKEIDADGAWVLPGFIDMHVHLREPGFEHKETIASGTRAAAMGGFTTVCAMPNTAPVIDNEIIVEYVLNKSARNAVVNVLPIGAVTRGQKGEELAGIGAMAKAGICAISEDGKTVANAGLYKTAMKYAAMFNLPVFSHCEEVTLSRGQVHEGSAAALMGLPGISSDSEEVIVSRDIILSKSTNAHLHICHASTAGSVELIRAAKARGESVSAEATPHHFTLTVDDLANTGIYDANYKMSPPLRSAKDRTAVLEGLKDGTIEIIATDHAPHHEDEKNCEFEKAANGIVGLETALSLCICELIDKGILTEAELIRKLSANPAKILGLSEIKGHLGEGADADITIVSPNEEYVINKASFASKGKNTPFDGRKVRGRVKYCIVNGETVVKKGELIK